MENKPKSCLCRVYAHEGRCWHTDLDYGRMSLPLEAYRAKPHDVELERDLLDVAFREYPQGGAFARRIGEGLRLGDELYGRRFEHRDNLAEAQEESRDSGCYLILELERLRSSVSDDDFQELRMQCIAGLVAAIELHEAIGRFASVRDGTAN